MSQKNKQIEHFADMLISAGEATSSLSKVEEELLALSDLLEANADIRRFLADVTISDEGKSETLDKLLSGKVSKILILFLSALQEEKAIHLLRAVIVKFMDKLSQIRYKTSGELISPVQLPEEKISAIEKETGRILGKKVTLRLVQKPNMLAGFIVRIGNYVIDASLDNALTEARLSMFSDNPI